MRSPIHSLASQIRDYVNTSWKHYQVRQDKALFFQLVSAMDAIEDAEAAIMAFKCDPIHETTGVLYLITYGLMQAFIIQQDAVQHLCEALKLPNTFTKYPQLRIIREIRNDSTGHPTKRSPRNGQPTSYHQISQITMSKQGFQLVSRFANGQSQFKNISFPNLIADQSIFITEMLKQVIEILETEVNAHKEKFRVEKLTAVFPSTLVYAFEKLNGVFWNGPIELGCVDIWDK